jgi:hypothetical protein
MILDFARPLKSDLSRDKGNPNRIERFGVQTAVERRDLR